MLVRDIAQALEAAGVGVLWNATTQTGDVFLVDKPTAPNNCIVIRPTGGFPPIAALEEEDLTAQVLTRNESTLVAHDKAWEAYNTLKGAIVAPSGRQMAIRSLQPPTPLGYDDQGRQEFIFNIAVITKRD